MGLQERKQKTKQRILASAAELFRTQGFAKTTMNDVAARSEVGVGTLYNYYPSKTELMIAIFREQIEDVPLQDFFAEGTIQSAADRIKQLTEVYVRRLIQQDRDLLRESIALALGADGEATEVAKHTMQLDEHLLQVMQGVILVDLQAGRLPADFDARLAVEIIHANAVALVMAYITNESMQVEMVMEQLHRRIDFLLQART